MLQVRFWSAVVVIGALSAQADVGGLPSVVGGTTVVSGENLLEVGLGHSDAVSVGWRHGVSSRIELGLVASGTFGYRGVLFMGGGYISGSALGAKLQGRFKAELLHTGIVSLGLSFEPGLSYATWKVGSIQSASRVDAFGLELPVDLKLGLALSERTLLGFRVEVPFFLELWALDGAVAGLVPISPFAYGPRVGVGIEHALSQSLLLYLHARVGLLNIVSTPTIDGQLGLAWRLPVA